MVVTAVTRALRGLTSGVAATGVMTAFLIASERSGIMRGQPPRMVIDRFAGDADDRAKDGAALLSHFAYGAAAGAVFAVMLGRRRSSPGAGVTYGLVLWALGYEGWLPALGVLPPAHRDHRGRAVTMVIAHVIYGRALAADGRRRSVVVE